MNDKFLGKLEELKKKGVYGITMWYGEGVGCDDLDIPTNERSILIVFYPVGCLGEVKGLIRTTVGEFLDYKFENPKRITNPPSGDELKKEGFYMWGTDRSIDEIIKKWKA